MYFLGYPPLIFDKVNVNIYILVMEKIKEILKRKIYWLPPRLINLVEKEAKKKGLKSDSVLMQQIIINWFQK